MFLKKKRNPEIIKKIIIDNNDKWLLINFSIHITAFGYALCRKYINRKMVEAKLHHMIIGRPINGLVVDHKNGNKLDNRKKNLHYVSFEYNISNRAKRKDSLQIYKGVTKRNKKWAVYVNPISGERKGERTYIGVYDTPEMARDIYFKEQKKIHQIPLYVRR